MNYGQEPDFQMIEETVQAGWRARDAARTPQRELNENIEDFIIHLIHLYFVL